MKMTRLSAMVLAAGALLGGSWVRGEQPSVGARTEDERRKAVGAAVRVNRQIPLPHPEALVAGLEARSLGLEDAEIVLLGRAATGGPLAEVARIELAETIRAENSAGALALSLPSLDNPATPEVRRAALDVVVDAVKRNGIGPEEDRLEAALPRMPRSDRRKLEVVLADPDDPSGRRILEKILRRDDGDLVALEAAEILDDCANPTPRERWLVAKCFFRHALYDRAASRFEALIEDGTRTIPQWEANFLRGRCAFRGDRLEEAAAWYRRAITLAANRERLAELRVHLARTLELGGNVEEAAEQARMAVLADTTDSRRLFLARLRLAGGREDLAERGLAGVRYRSERSRGRLLIALHALAEGRVEDGLEALDGVSNRPWRGPARVVAAGLLLEAGRVEEALDRLVRAAPELDLFWGLQARRIMAKMPAASVDAWRGVQRAAVLGGGRGGRRALAVWGRLEPERVPLGEVRDFVADRRPLDIAMETPVLEGLAGDLWDLGLRDAAIRWNPGGLPTGTPDEALWTARVFSAGNAPSRAIRTADHTWRVLGSDLPLRVYPEVLEFASFPLPYLQEVRLAAAGAEVDWAVVAGVAREESRWDPDVLSRVGARGLMQLMPSTAVAVAAGMGDEAPSGDDLFDPELSLRLGSTELGRLHEVFGGFSAPAVAAYNAGEAQARLWLEQCGKDCDPGRYLLTITFNATRTYTADVLAAAEIYRGRFMGRSERPRAAPVIVQPSGRSPD